MALWSMNTFPNICTEEMAAVLLAVMESLLPSLRKKQVVYREENMGDFSIEQSVIYLIYLLDCVQNKIHILH